MKTVSCGDVAQLGERGVRNAEVRGSIPLISTKLPHCVKCNRRLLTENIFDVNQQCVGSPLG